MQARALKKYIRTSPRKMRLIIDLIRGKKVNDAINILRFSKQMASKTAEMTLRSAVSNLINKAEEKELSVDETEMIVKEAFSNAGPTMKRIRPAPMGRAYRVRKRTNHLTVVVEAPGLEDELLEGEDFEEEIIEDEPVAEVQDLEPETVEDDITENDEEITESQESGSSEDEQAGEDDNKEKNQ